MANQHQLLGNTNQDLITDLVTNATEFTTIGSRWTTEETNGTVDSPPYTTTQIAVLGFLAGTVCLVTIIGNLVVLLSFFLEHTIRQPTNYFIASLAVTDLTIGCVSMPFYTVYLLDNSYWPLGELLCDLWLSVDYTVCLSSIYTVFCITVDRFCSVTIPTSYRHWRTERKVMVIIAIVWIVPILVFFTTIFGWQYFVGIRTVPEGKCYVQYMESFVFNTVLQIGYFWITLIVMCSLYVGIYRTALSLQRKADIKRRNNERTASIPTETRVEKINDEAAAASTLNLNGYEHFNAKYSSHCISIGVECLHPGLGGPRQNYLPKRSHNTSQADNEKSSTAFSSDTDPSGTSYSKHSSGDRNSGTKPAMLRSTTIVTVETYDSISRAENKDSDEVTHAITSPASDDVSAGVVSGRETGKHSVAGANGDLKTGICNRSSCTQKLKDVENIEQDIGIKQNLDLYIGLSTSYTRTVSNGCETTFTECCENGSDAADDSSPVWVKRGKVNSKMDAISIEGEREAEEKVRSNSEQRDDGFQSETFATSPHIYEQIKTNNKSRCSDADRKSLDNLFLGTMNGWFRQLRCHFDETFRKSSGGAATAVSTWNKTKRHGRARKALRTITLILGAFVFCWTPWHVLSLIMGFCPDCVWPVLYDVSYWLCYLNSPINPFCYAFANRQFRKTFIRIVKLDWHRS